MARTILLADDSVTAQNMGRRILADAGYEVITVNNGSAALKKIAELKPDLVVLDVYMPGYGGLEVCHRLKEARETARIPVLLTVGKLEPFKPDEARRVRADAFIVKPFEASELLTALTKLEDKIVPHGQSQKPGRFGKALATIKASEGDERFGDKETGWKDRLIIPSGPAKPEEPEVGAPIPASSAPGDLGRGGDFKPAEARQEFEPPIPAVLPPDITAEEIAAITAAAAAFGGKVEAPGVTAEPVPEAEAKTILANAEAAATEVSAAEAPLVTLASGPSQQAEPVAEAKPLVQAEPAPEAMAGQERITPAESTSGEFQEPAVADETNARAEPGAVITPAEVKPWGRDAEVLAAIASLVPSDAGAGGGEPSTGSAETGPSAGEVLLPAAGVATPPVAGASSGPRWVAEAVAVSEDESRLSLEREMEDAHTVVAVTEAAKASSVVVPAEWEAASAVVEVATAEAHATASAETLVSSGAVVPEIKEEAAFAAAASGSFSSESAPVGETASVAAGPSEAAPVAEEGETRHDAELAAAWQNWKQIRETLVGEQLTSQIADAAAAEIKASQEQAESSETAPAEAVAEEENAAEAQGEPAAIARIVDSVLAELKPKLVEEIARKMNAEKKGKGKKGKK